MKNSVRVVAGLVITLLLFVGAYLHAVDYLPLAHYALKKVAGEWDALAAANTTESTILFCGTGSPARTRDRGSPCHALIHKGKLFMFDAGEGAMGKLTEYHAPVIKLERVFLTHLHSDHIAGVGEILQNSWLNGRKSPVVVMGPPGTEKMLAGFRQVYAEDVSERLRALADDKMIEELTFGKAEEINVGADEIKTVYQDDGLSIEAFRVNHPEWHAAYGYRIKLGNKTIVISGDTTVSDGIRKYAQGADILIHEVIHRDFMSLLASELAKSSNPISAHRMKAIINTHTDRLELAKLAQEIGVKNLYLTHLIPPIPDVYFAKKAFTSGMDDLYSGELTVTSDGMRIRVD